MVRHDCPCEPAGSRGSWGWAGLELQTPRAQATTQQVQGIMQLLQLQQLHCTSRPAMAPPVLLQGQEEQSGRLGESWHVEYHPRVIMPWNIASKRATAITTLTNYA